MLASNEKVVAAADDPAGLYLSPNLCLLSAQEQSCQIKIEARWKTQNIGNYCLVLDKQELSLNCWSQSSRGQFIFELEIEENHTIVLIDSDSGQKQFSQTVRLQRQVNRYRKKRRNPWQFY